MRQRPASEDAKGLEAKLPLTNFWGERNITKILAALETLDLGVLDPPALFFFGVEILKSEVFFSS